MTDTGFLAPVKLRAALTEQQAAKFAELVPVWCNVRNFCLYRLNEDPARTELALANAVRTAHKFPLRGISAIALEHAVRNAKLQHRQWKQGKSVEPSLADPASAPYVRVGDRAHGVTAEGFTSPDLGVVAFAYPLDFDPGLVAAVSLCVSGEGHEAHVVRTRLKTGGQTVSGSPQPKWF